MARGRHVKHARSAAFVVAIALGIVLLALGGVSFAAYRYDQASSDRILPGVSIAGTDVGGMTRAEAITAVERAAQERLTQRLTVRVAGESWKTTPAKLGQSADVATAVDQALQASDSVGFVTRVWRRLREEPVDISVDLTFTSGGTGIADLVSGIAADVIQTPRDASVSVVEGEVTFVHSRPGHALGANIGARRLQAALDEDATAVRLPVRTVKPRVPDAKIGKTIVVDRTTNELFLYDRFELETLVSRRHRRRGVRHASRRLDDHRQAREPDVDQPRSGHVGRGPPGVHPARSRQPARDACPLPERAGDPDPRNVGRELYRHPRIARMHPDADVRRRADLSAGADRHPRDRLLSRSISCRSARGCLKITWM